MNRATLRFSVAGLALLASTRVDAQCADGSAPPCRQGAGVARPVPVDPNRIAVLPFRVTTADSLLGEGFAELLAPEFTGQGGPRAVEMSTTIAAWRRAGGGLRTPLPQDASMRVARSLGAGVLVQGVIVGFGSRLTVNASLVDATSGSSIGAPARASGVADSIETLLSQVATTLLGAGARARAAESGRLTNSTAALRSYFEGLSLWRRGRWGAAEAAFEASIAADSMFASAIYQRWLLAAAQTGQARWARRVEALKARLTPRERTVVEGYLGAAPDQPRTRMQSLADRRRAAETLGDSPEAWYLYGDYLFHYGPSVTAADSILPLARDAFARAAAADSQPMSLSHLMETAVNLRDTAMLRRLWPYYQALEGEERFTKGWLIAGMLRDQVSLARLRQAGPDATPSAVSISSLYPGLASPIPVALMEEAYRRVGALGNPAIQETAEYSRWLLHAIRGRPVAAAQQVTGKVKTMFAVSQFELGGWVSGDLREDLAFVRQFGAVPQPDSIAEGRRQCALARLSIQGGRPDTVNVSAQRFRNTRCRRSLEAWQAFAANSVTDSLVQSLDSLVSNGIFSNFLGFEHRLLARIYEARSDTVKAARAIRLYPHDFHGAWFAPTLREQGRYDLMVRDTARAIQSYTRYLELRAEAEAPLFVERDSITALVATLRRR